MLSKENLQEVYPLTPMQEGLFFHALYEPDSLAYLQQITYCLRGALDVGAFETAWNQLIQRHDVLRTVFIHRKRAGICSIAGSGPDAHRISG